jgi:hypothetical protein
MKTDGKVTIVGELPEDREKYARSLVGETATSESVTHIKHLANFNGLEFKKSTLWESFKALFKGGRQ